jgi:murein DD-endopeptidase MepM/ murein hydrolase activator NlpD
MMVFKRYGALFIALFTLFTAPVFAQLMDDERIIDAQVKSQFAVFQRNNETWQGEVLTSDYRFEGEWAFGMAFIRVPDGIHGEPDLRLFIAKQDSAGNWQTALEYSPQFYEWAAQTPDTLMGFGQKQNLKSAGRAFEAAAPKGNPLSRLSLPYATDTGWMLLGGPHGNNGDSVRPWTALDLNPDLSTSERILAAREGYVYRSSACPNYVRVDHPDGWQTGYYHVKDEQVANGQYVERGAWLGNTSSRTGCGGWASGPHVHFTLKYNGVYQNIHGHDIGGWTVQEGDYAYEGCMIRVRDGLIRCKPGGVIFNDGSIGSGYYDSRYDYNQDNVPDIWAVNQRDSGTNSTSIRIASGAAPQTPLLEIKTGMPQQPDWLNTAFASADYDGDDVPDLWVIHRWDSANNSAFRIMDGAQPQYLIADEITALPLYDNSVSFAVDDYNRDGTPDLWAINPRDGSKGSVSVQIINGASPKQVLAYSGTSLPAQSPYADISFAVADYNADGYPDLWAMNPRDKQMKSVSVRVISGRDWQSTLVYEGTSLPHQSTDITSFSFIVADQNRDSYPDVWLVNRINSSVRVISGKNLTTELLNSGSWLPASSNADWHILGSDRARETIAPEAPKLNRPKVEIPVNETSVGLRWKPAGLATRYTVTLMNSAGGAIASGEYSAESVCSGKWCSVNTGVMGATLGDNQMYQWMVTARNNYGSTESERHTFTTDIPGEPVLVFPLNGSLAANNTTFNWEPRPAADEYKLVVKNTLGTFKTKVKATAQSCVTGLCTVFSAEALLPDTYLWKVVAKNTSVSGKSKSAAWTFTVLNEATATPTAAFTETATPEPMTSTPTETPPMTEAPLNTVTPSPTPIVEETPTPDIIPLP